MRKIVWVLCKREIDNYGYTWQPVALQIDQEVFLQLGSAQGYQTRVKSLKEVFVSSETSSCCVAEFSRSVNKHIDNGFLSDC